MKLLDKKWKWAVAGILLLGSAILLYMYVFLVFWPGPSLWDWDEEASRRLLIKESCELEGGFFVEALDQCKLPATDAGKACSDSSECEGFCEVNLAPGDLSKIANGERVEKTGACGQSKNFFTGCSYVVEDGMLERFCAD